MASEDVTTMQMEEDKTKITSDDFRLILAFNYFKIWPTKDELPYEIAGRVVNYNNYYDNEINDEKFVISFRKFYNDDVWKKMNDYDTLVSELAAAEVENCLSTLNELINRYEITYVYTFGYSQAIGRILFVIQNNVNHKIRFMDINMFQTYGHNSIFYNIEILKNKRDQFIRKWWSTKGDEININSSCEDTSNKFLITELSQKIARQFIPGYDKKEKTLDIIREQNAISFYDFSSDKALSLIKKNYVPAYILVEINFLSVAILRRIFEYEIKRDSANEDDILFIVNCIYLNLKLPQYIEWNYSENGVVKFSIKTGSRIYYIDNGKYPLNILSGCRQFITEKIDNYNLERPETPVCHVFSGIEENLINFIKPPLPLRDVF